MTSSNLNLGLGPSDLIDTPILQSLLDVSQIGNIELGVEFIEGELIDFNANRNQLGDLKPNEFHNNEINLDNLNLTDSLSDYAISWVDSVDRNQSQRVLKKRGRKKNNENNVSTNRLKRMQRKINKIKSEGGIPVCFGNKVVDRSSEQYRIERNRNNNAVMRLRQVQSDKMKQQEEKIEFLELEISKQKIIIINLQQKLLHYQNHQV
jgi:hypothetical protein